VIADDEIQARIDALQNGIGCKGRRHKNHGDGCASLRRCVSDGIEDRHLIREALTAFAWRHACRDLRAVVEAELRVACAEAAGDTLDETRVQE
jgi:hypothetical protein